MVLKIRYFSSFWICVIGRKIYLWLALWFGKMDHKEDSFVCRGTGKKTHLTFNLPRARSGREEAGASTVKWHIENPRETGDLGIAGCKNTIQFFCASKFLCICKDTLSLAFIEPFHMACYYNWRWSQGFCCWAILLWSNVDAVEC